MLFKLHFSQFINASQYWRLVNKKKGSGELITANMPKTHSICNYAFTFKKNLKFTGFKKHAYKNSIITRTTKSINRKIKRLLIWFLCKMKSGMIHSISH